MCYGWKISIYLFEHVLLTDRIHETGILTTEFIPVVLLTDRMNGTVIITTKLIPVLLMDGEGGTDILTN